MPAAIRRGRRRERLPLYPRVYETETLIRAWRAVRRGGGPGVDGQTIAAFEARWPEQMAEVAAELGERRYHPRPLRQFLLPKAAGGDRPISVLALRDRVVQRAVLEVVRPLFVAAASPAAFGALPGRGVGEALARTEQARRTGNGWIARTAIHAFFDEVDHARILSAFLAVTADDALAELIEEWLAVALLQRPAAAPALAISALHPAAVEELAEAEPGALAERGLPLLRGLRALEEDWPSALLVRPLAQALVGRAGRALLRRRSGAALVVLGAGAAVAGGAVAALAAGRRPAPAAPAARGTPQGSPLSPLLATSVLDPFDRALDRPDRALTRYVDDIVLVCRDEELATRGLAEAEQQLTRLGLRLNAAKTVVQPYDAGFSFLGASLPQLLRYTDPGLRRSGRWSKPSIARATGGRGC